MKGKMTVSLFDCYICVGHFPKERLKHDFKKAQNQKKEKYFLQDGPLYTLIDLWERERGRTIQNAK